MSNHELYIGVEGKLKSPIYFSKKVIMEVHYWTSSEEYDFSVKSSVCV